MGAPSSRSRVRSRARRRVPAAPLAVATVRARARCYRLRTRRVPLYWNVPARNLSPIDCACTTGADNVCRLSLPT